MSKRKACPERSRRGFILRRGVAERKRGFTLIELLVVIAIIGILAGVVLATTYVAKQKARVAAGKGMLSSIPTAMAICLDDGGKILWPGNNQPICNPTNVINDKNPDLSSTHWQYQALLTNGASFWEITAYCIGSFCGKTNIAACGFQYNAGSTSGHGCHFQEY